jgi:hypothetical protein
MTDEVWQGFCCTRPHPHDTFTRFSRAAAPSFQDWAKPSDERHTIRRLLDVHLPGSIYHSASMRFIQDRRAIPDELLYARDEGRVAFFCGAGSPEHE